MTNYNNNIEKELSWDDEISQESSYVLLPEGDYNFTVTSYERARHAGSEKLPPCNKAVVNIKIVSPEGQETIIRHNLFLHTSTEGMLSSFFSSIGLKKKGEPLRMNWNMVPGSRGRCKVTTKEYNGNNYNQISKFYAAEESKGFTPGSF